jgi:hypothetical protein
MTCRPKTKSLISPRSEFFEPCSFVDALRRSSAPCNGSQCLVAGKAAYTVVDDQLIATPRQVKRTAHFGNFTLFNCDVECGKLFELLTLPNVRFPALPHRPAMTEVGANRTSGRR